MVTVQTEAETLVEVGPELRKRVRRGISAATISRWSRYGARVTDGQVVRLRTKKLLGRWFAAPAELDRFVAAVRGRDNAQSA